MTGENKRSATFGALILGQYDKQGNMKAIGKSSGFTDEMLGKLYKTIMAMMNNPALSMIHRLWQEP